MSAKYRKTGRFDDRLDRGERRKHFALRRLPHAEDYFATLFGPVRFNASGWALVRCCFHSPDNHPSMGIHRDGGFKCHACGASGGSIINFEMLRSGTDFKTAVRDLGAQR
jgi:hypothetical protein